MDFQWARGFSLSQAFDLLNEDDNIRENVEKIFIDPPEANMDSDEDSADEDDGGLVSNLTGRQLRAPAEIKLVNNERLGSDNELTEKVFNNDEWITHRLVNKDAPSWLLGADLLPTVRPFPDADYTRYNGMSPVDIFELFFDNSVITHLVEETQRYSQFKNEADPNITASEIKCFIGILILSGYNFLPSKRMYWEMKDDV